MTYSPPLGSIPTLGVPSITGVRRAHLIGIGGAGMRGIAQLLLARGVAVSGSDLKDSRGLDDLRSLGATVFVGHAAAQLDALGTPDAVVVSSAIPSSNSELGSARDRGIAVLARAQVLAALMEGSRVMAVAGTHGKTTATSMLCTALSRGGLDPTYVVGGDLNESGSGARQGTGEWFLAETDESDGSFLLLRPEVAVVTNVEADHVDFYPSEKELREAFARFIEQSGRVVACGDDAGAREVLRLAGREAITYGTGQHNDVVLEVARSGSPGAAGTLMMDGRRIDVELRIPGTHNLLNAAATIVAASFAGMPSLEAAEALSGFTGVRRRFEFRGVARGAEFFDDYAHHPTEVAATLEAARDGHSRILAVFQPHRYTRTRAFWRPLGESLQRADLVVVTDVYGAGEDPIPGVTGKLVVEGLAESSPGRRVLYLPHRADLVRFLCEEIRPGDLVVTLGAGDITTVADETIARIRGLAG